MSKHREVLSSPLQQYRHTILHHGPDKDHPIPAEPYLYFPFSRDDLIEAARHDTSGRFGPRYLYHISEGMYYSLNEQRIHGKKVHGGIDIDAPHGTRISSPIDGIAMSSYHSFPILDAQGKPRMYQQKQVYFGFGYFVQVYNPKDNRFIILAHMSDISEAIPFSKPKFDEESNSWSPTSHDIPIARMQDHSALVKVNRGDVIGRVGFSGLRWGYNEHNVDADRPVPLDLSLFYSWDTPHLHFEELFRDPVSGVRGLARDPYDIYLRSRNYPTPSRQRPMGAEPLWVIGDSDLPQYAR